VNREAELDRPSRIARSDFLGCGFRMSLAFLQNESGKCKSRNTDKKPSRLISCGGMWPPIKVQMSYGAGNAETAQTSDDERQAPNQLSPVMTVAEYASSANKQADRNTKYDNCSKHPQSV
jgi:hypothetical protein